MDATGEIGWHWQWQAYREATISNTGENKANPVAVILPIIVTQGVNLEQGTDAKHRSTQCNATAEYFESNTLSQ